MRRGDFTGAKQKTDMRLDCLKTLLETGRPKPEKNKYQNKTNGPNSETDLHTDIMLVSEGSFHTCADVFRGLF